MEMAIHFPNIGIHLEYVPRLLQTYGFQISIYGMLLAVGMLLGAAYVVVLAKRANQNPNDYLDMIILAGIGAAAGGHLFYVLLHMEVLRADMSQLWNFRNGGFILYGALLGGCLMVLLFCVVKKCSLWKAADIICMGALLVQITGRLGNFFNRECFGDYTDTLLAMQIPADFVRPAEMTALMEEKKTFIEGTAFVQVHPAFLYEALWCLLLFLFLMKYRHIRKFSGEIFAVYLLGYSLGRIWIEGLRADRVLIPGTYLPISQVIAAVLIVICALWVLIGRYMARKRRNARRKQEDSL